MLALHLTTKKAYRAYYDQWVGDKLLSILLLLGVQAQLNEAMRKQLYDRGNKSLHSLLKLSSPFKSDTLTPDQEAKQAAIQAEQDKGKALYLQMLGGAGGFSSLDELQKAIVALNTTIRELQEQK